MIPTYVACLPFSREVRSGYLAGYFKTSSDDFMSPAPDDPIAIVAI
jgi:hypothetical protein